MTFWLLCRSAPGSWLLKYALSLNQNCSVWPWHVPYFATPPTKLLGKSIKDQIDPDEEKVTGPEDCSKGWGYLSHSDALWCFFFFLSQCCSLYFFNLQIVIRPRRQHWMCSFYWSKLIFSLKCWLRTLTLFSFTFCLHFDTQFSLFASSWFYTCLLFFS